ncbi:hypothetical protein IVB27_35490 [Bradyrhizobium sp. 197]|uniref:hypothetical protein n=1 Tax=Bradyrhizobium sp. 197 TaxID=2782663 RepID=UPI001FF931D7|nr:hypothetical protein [Bradyrhizobium sp. 197]MCK1479905.1 hypothetical protein [Bradyrhizobium sp. 197]
MVHVIGRNEPTGSPLLQMVKTSDKFRENAQNCLQLAEEATNAQAALRYKRMAQAWSALATEQDWLDGVSDTE